MRNSIRYASYLIPLFIMALLKAPIAFSAQKWCSNFFADEKHDKSIRKLYKQDKNRRRYGKILLKIKPGDILDFGAGERFEVKAILGQGETTFVVETKNGLVLRIPKASPKSIFSKKSDRDEVLESFVEEFIEIQKELKEAGVPVVEIDFQRSNPPKYLVVQKLDLHFTLAEYIQNLETPQNLNLTPIQMQELSNALVEFAKTTWRYERIGNFRTEQIGWDGKRWVLFDFAYANKRISQLNMKTNIFSSYKVEDNWGNYIEEPLPKAMYQMIENAISSIRESKYNKKVWIERENYYSSRSLIHEAMQPDELIGMLLEVDKPDNLIENENSKSYIEFKILKILKKKARTILYSVEVEGVGEGFLEVKTRKFDDEDPFFNSELKMKPNLRLISYGDDYVLYFDK